MSEARDKRAGREAGLADASPGASHPDLRTSRVVIEGVEYVVLSHPILAPAGVMGGLSEAQRAIALGLLDGLSYRDLAARRGTSPRTVAKQVEGLYRRLGVASRAELVAALSGPGGSRTAPGDEDEEGEVDAMADLGERGEVGRARA